MRRVLIAIILLGIILSGCAKRKPMVIAIATTVPTITVPSRQTNDTSCNSKLDVIYAIFGNNWENTVMQYEDAPLTTNLGYVGRCIDEGWIPILPTQKPATPTPIPNTPTSIPATPVLDKTCLTKEALAYHIKEVYGYGIKFSYTEQFGHSGLIGGLGFVGIVVYTENGAGCIKDLEISLALTDATEKTLRYVGSLITVPGILLHHLEYKQDADKFDEFVRGVYQNGSYGIFYGGGNYATWKIDMGTGHTPVIVVIVQL